MSAFGDRWISFLGWIVLLAVAGSAVVADGALSVALQGVSGNTVTVAVHNGTGQTVSGTIVVEVVQGGVTHVAHAGVTVGAGQSLSVPITVGTITDDVVPWGEITLGILY